MTTNPMPSRTTATPAPPTTGAASGRSLPPPAPTGKQTARNRKAGNFLDIIGKGAGLAGAVAIAVGGVLPWATLSLFGMPLAFPGILSFFGALCLGLAILALTWGRSFAWLWVGAGIVCMVLGQQAEQTVGREVVRYKLRTQMALAEVNSRLAQVALPPIEPFPSIGAAKDHVGPGPLWVLTGGAILASGGLLQIAGGRLRRTCGNCGLPWSLWRTTPVFCPRCGTPVSEQHHCQNCRQVMEDKDNFCAHCGTPSTEPSEP